MSQHTSLLAASPWVELGATAQDWAKAEPSLLSSMLVQLHLIRAFEEMVLELASEGLIHGPAHSSIGQEGGAVGSILQLRSDDTINGSHRGHHQFLAKSLGHVAPQGLTITAPFSDAVSEVLYKSMAEILGLAPGYCKGRGGSMHLRWAEAGALGTNATVGGGVPFLAGSAWAAKQAGTDAVSVTYFGDGAINIGSVLETMNLAAVWKLPLCFFVENNHYAVATTVAESTAEPRLSARGLGFNIPSWRVDGMDPLAVHLAMSEAVAHMRSGQGPTIIEADLYRFFHQSGSFAGSAFGYRSKEEELRWRERDPLAKVAAEMLTRELCTEAEIDALRARAQEALREVAAQLLELEPGAQKEKRRIRPTLWPDPGFKDVGVRGDLSELAPMRREEARTFAGALANKRFVDVIAEVTQRRMETDPRVVTMGEDIHRLKGGINGATRGLKDMFPDRVLGTPICENAFVGLAGGMAMDGRYVPIVEFMFPDFMWVAADQVFNQIAKARHMFGSLGEMPLVLRCKVAVGSGYGSQHSMDPAGIFATSPGWRIVAPSTPFDYIGLMNAAIACRDPVLVMEHVDLYQVQGQVPEVDRDFVIPFGSAAVRRTGAAVTILTYLSMVSKSLQAVEQSELDAEVIDLRSLDAASIDWATIEASVRKTNSVLIVEQGARGTSYGGWLADEIQRRCFDWLDQPVQRVTGGEAWPSVSRVLERASCASVDDIAQALTEMSRNLGVAA